MFNIDFIDTLSSSNKSITKTGEITIGEFKEYFHSSLSYWDQQQYLNQWKEGINRICVGELKSALIIDMYNPDSSNIIQWWVLYRYKDLIYVRNQLLFLENLQEKFIEENVYRYIQERPLANKNGKKISEWEVNISECHNTKAKLAILEM